MDAALDLWWGALRAVACLNVVLWLAVARRSWRQRGSVDASESTLRGALLWLAAGYVAGCAWRSWLPVFDVPRQVIVDSFLSSALVGRSVATVAELCFAAQWALLLHAAAGVTRQAGVTWAARALVPLIAVAETFSWHAVLSTSNFGHAIEESLWCAAAVVVGAALFAVRSRVDGAARRWASGGAAIAAVYAAYLAGIDVPMYWQRWIEQSATGHVPLGLAEGLADMATRWTVSHRWADWRSEVGWMSAYFSIGVWCSLALVCWPRWRAPDGQRTAAPGVAKTRPASARATWPARAR
jgi:hypothetical protein